MWVAASSYAQEVETQVITRRGQPVRVKSADCAVTAEGNELDCSAVVQNIGKNGITALGVQWETLDADKKVLEKASASYDYAYPHPEAEGALERTRRILCEMTLPYSFDVDKVHFHVMFVEVEDGTVPGGGEKSGALTRLRADRERAKREGP
jgi:hypothetical protein